MNPTSYLTIYRNNFTGAIDANNTASVHLRKAKDSLGSIENKLQYANYYMSESARLISVSSEHLKFEDEVIKRCLERLKSLDRSLKNYNETGKELSNTDFRIKEKSELQNKLPEHQNLPPQGLPDKYSEIDINNKNEVLFWSKNFNAARPDIIEAMQKLNTKCWVELWKYFSGGGRPFENNIQFILNE